MSPASREGDGMPHPRSFTVAVVGCGAMGSVYAGLLGAAGNDVLAIDHSERHVEAIRRDGLRVEGASGDRRVPLRASTTVPEEEVDLVVIAVKAAQARGAAQDARQLLGPDTVVLTIQNGLGAAAEVAEEVGPDRLAVGIAGGFGASVQAPGHVRHAAMRTIRFGSHDGLNRDRVGAVAEAWRAAGFSVEVVEDVRRMQWEKLICNVAFSGPCALTGQTVGDAMDDPHVGPVCFSAAVEAWTVAQALGVPVDVDDPVAYVREFGETVRTAKPSVLQDLEAGHRSEIDVINGAVPREAAAADVDAPVNATITALVRQRERVRRGG